MTMTRLAWLWPIVITLSLIAAVSAIVADLPQPLRAAIVLWFIFVCPDMAFVRLLRLKEAWIEWVLAVALSMAIDLLVAAFILYVGLWSPVWILVVIAILTLAGVLFQLASTIEQSYSLHRQQASN
jgi:hypothetical protein